MTNWYLINPQPTFNSNFEKDEFVEYALDGFDELLTETQLGKEVVLCKGKFDGTYFAEEYQTEGIVQSETPDIYTQGYKRQLLTRVGEISDYKYVKYKGSIWLIMNEPADNCIYDKCVLHQCNYILKWLDKDRNVIYYPACIENASQYNTGEDGNKIVMLGNNQYMASVSLDDTTASISRTLRLFVDYNKVAPIPYKVSRPDTVAYSYGSNRVMQLILSEDQFNPKTDSIEYMLCDYYTNENPFTSPIEITHIGGSYIRIGGSYKSFTANVQEPVNWDVIATDTVNKEISTNIVANENKIKIKCADNINLVGSSFRLKCTDASGNIGELLVDIVGGV